MNAGTESCRCVTCVQTAGAGHCGRHGAYSTQAVCGTVTCTIMHLVVVVVIAAWCCAMFVGPKEEASTVRTRAASGGVPRG